MTPQAPVPPSAQPSTARPAGADPGGFFCACCWRERSRDERAGPRELRGEVLALAAANTPGWQAAHGMCRECAARFAEARTTLSALQAGGGVVVLSTALRLGAVDRYRGRGVGIAFLDSGFFAHPDLTTPVDRIRHYVDVTNRRARRSDLRQPDASSWHGMMTSVVACGNGSLSGGFYRGLASEAHLVLVKCGSVRRIRHDDIRRGLRWVVRHRRRLGIRVVSVSCGGDYERSYLHDGLSQAVEWATRAGLLVVAAAGNLGHRPGHPVLPPASAPSALTVGGLNDQRWPSFSGYEMYPSSYGPTVDGLQKPEVIAPGIWVAAPILPGTPTAAQAELLARLAHTPDSRLADVVAAQPGIDPDLDAAARLDAALLRQLVRAKIHDNNVISGSYKHVDGTSFAAPIVASVAAQMIEANPALKPQQIKHLLLSSARRLPHVPAERQGFGVVDARAAVLAAEASARLPPAQPAGEPPDGTPGA